MRLIFTSQKKKKFHFTPDNLSLKRILSHLFKRFCILEAYFIMNEIQNF